MSKWITVYTTSLPQDAYPPKALLESQGIKVFIKDELTAQMHNFLSNAIGGAKLQVSENDVEEAIRILKETGYIREYNKKDNKFIKNFDRMTSGIPLFGKMILEFRLVVFLAMLIFILIALIMVFSQSEMVSGFEYFNLINLK